VGCSSRSWRWRSRAAGAVPAAPDPLRPGLPGRLDDWPKRLLGQVTEVFGQVRLLKWNVPGIAHFFVFWGFLVLFLTIVEAYGHLFTDTFAIPLIGRSPVLGFLEDFFGVAVGLG
jgi:hypothetical protein